MLKKLLNLPESVTDQRLREVCEEFDAHVFPKVRVADVLKIERSGISDELYRYALQAHFDFVVSDSGHQPLFAVEFDGPTHSEPDAKRRDKMKNELCERFEFSLLRVNRRYLSADFSNWDLLRWFCTVFFVKQAWDRDVESGKIPYEDSVFDPMFVSVKTKSGWRSLELERTARAKLSALFQAGEIPFHIPNWITARDGDRCLRAIACIATSKDQGVICETAMQHHSLGGWVQFAVRGIVLSQLVSHVEAFLDDRGEALPLSQIESQMEEFKTSYEPIMSFGVVSS